MVLRRFWLSGLRPFSQFAWLLGDLRRTNGACHRLLSLSGLGALDLCSGVSRLCCALVGVRRDFHRERGGGWAAGSGILGSGLPPAGVGVNVGQPSWNMIIIVESCVRPNCRWIDPFGTVVPARPWMMLLLVTMLRFVAAVDIILG